MVSLLFYDLFLFESWWHKRTRCFGFTDSQIYNFVASNSVILHEHLLWKREKQEKEKQTWLLKKLIWQIYSTNFRQRISKHMSVSMGNSHTDRMFKTMAQNKEKRRECCSKIWSPKNYVALENECKKARERFNRNFFTKVTTKIGELFINML